MIKRLLIGLFVLIAGLSITARAADAPAEQNWGQWRGLAATGVAPAGDPPVRWDEKTNIKWKVKLPGSGTGTPVVWGNRIFLEAAINTGRVAHAPAELPSLALGAAPAGGGGRRGGPGGGGAAPTQIHQFVLICLDRETGKTLWQKTAREEVPHQGHHPDHGFASYSACTDGQLVFAYFGSRGLHCYDMVGNLKWQKDFGKMQTKMSFGEGSTPALAGDRIIVNWDHEGPGFIVALDKATGNELWRTPRDEETTWATPLIVRNGEQTQVVVGATKKIRSYDLANGKQIWECAGLTANVIPSPVAADGVVYATSGFRGNAMLAIRLGRSGDLAGTDAIAWTHKKATPYVPSPLLYGDRIYFFSGNQPTLTCLDIKTGRPVIDAQRIDGLDGIYASPVGAADRVYLIGRGGTTVVIKRSDKVEVLATNRLDEKFDASPAIAGKSLLLRGHEYLYCIEEK